MSNPVQIPSGRALPALAVSCCLVLGLALVPVVISGQKKTAGPRPTSLEAFQPGETLTYEVSWSRIITAGTAVMQVRAEPLPDGREGIAFLLTGRTTGLLGKVFPVHDLVRSMFDPRTMQSLSYSIAESYGKKRRHRTLVFDHGRNTVVFTQNDEPPRTLAVPTRVQDPLSSLYYLRIQKDFTIGRPIVIEVHDSGKNWSIEVHTLGRETVKTPAGEFAAIKVKTRPTYEGVFLGKGEAFLWLTDDARKVPVLMKSTIRIGSFVFTLTDMKP
ncbi:MAG TPA: DUF3108 domain-containing protein [Nitrospirota bacterium]|nr:DUF3108 domain-containing protein [Nitrospirota bacterium]